ncbi:single-stranded-DNA-specific exonuclease RecJ [Clostridium cellulovorans 743B]|uniref:Single-stranded-DNA-specific exonuclease RecJ n=2 Tax=Clostridium cellulovorans TaxID=1493 RepID=D9SPV1_CLOC7|nr:single-stranded-DNA-specific exonuclease RecJ [Clostridium cellulovorans 743B]
MTKAAQKLATDSFISPIIAKLLWDRGIRDKDEVEKFLKGSIDEMYDPFLMKDMDLATSIIIKAIFEEKKIVIYGDYDVDGVTSTVIMFKALKRVGARVTYHIPDREKEGYGLNKKSIEVLREQGNSVIITVDNGIAAVEEVKYAKEIGFQVVITDHHDLPFEENEKGERKEILPNADAIINPKRSDCNYPFKYLCGASIAFKFAVALFIKRKIDYKEAYNEYLQFAGIATVCDVVDLIDENRVILKNALKSINNSKNIGINSLRKFTLSLDKEISVYAIGFVMGPCINATGRLENAKMAVELLLTKELEIAENLAKELVDLNKTRQDMTTEGVEKVVKEIELGDYYNDKVLVVYEPTIHESIAGIIAGRIREKYNKPTIILTKAVEGVKGSARSIEEYNIYEELLKCKNLLDKFGGHPMAAGMSLKEENIEPLRETLNGKCILTDEDMIPKVVIDFPLSSHKIDDSIIYDIGELAPFGKGNSTPLFGDKNLLLEKAMVFGSDNGVLKLVFNVQGRRIDAVAFKKYLELMEIIEENWVNDNYGELLPYSTGYLINIPQDLRLDIIYTPEFNEYKGNKKIQLKVHELRISK